MKKAEPGDWKTKPMPERQQRFPLEMDLTPEELERLRRGHIPREMEDKWFLVFENGVFFAFRSWTGFCIYEIPVGPDGAIRGGAVNRDPEQYRETNPGRDGVMAEYLVSRQVGRSGTRELMMKYIRWGKETKA